MKSKKMTNVMHDSCFSIQKLKDFSTYLQQQSLRYQNNRVHRDMNIDDVIKLYTNFIFYFTNSGVFDEIGDDMEYRALNFGAIALALPNINISTIDSKDYYSKILHFIDSALSVELVPNGTFVNSAFVFTCLVYQLWLYGFNINDSIISNLKYALDYGPNKYKHTEEISEMLRMLFPTKDLDLCWWRNTYGNWRGIGHVNANYIEFVQNCISLGIVNNVSVSKDKKKIYLHINPDIGNGEKIVITNGDSGIISVRAVPVSVAGQVSSIIENPDLETVFMDSITIDLDPSFRIFTVYEDQIIKFMKEHLLDKNKN